MSEKVKKIRVKQADGTMSDYIPLGANAEDIDLKNGLNVEQMSNKKPYYFNSIADMKVAEYLKEGDYAITLGYYEPNDEKDGEYLIRVKENEDVEGSDLIYLLQNNLVAELIKKSYSNRERVFKAICGNNVYVSYSSNPEEEKNRANKRIHQAKLVGYDEIVLDIHIKGLNSYDETKSTIDYIRQKMTENNIKNNILKFHCTNIEQIGLEAYKTTILNTLNDFENINTLWIFNEIYYSFCRNNINDCTNFVNQLKNLGYKVGISLSGTDQIYIQRDDNSLLNSLDMIGLNYYPSITTENTKLCEEYKILEILENFISNFNNPFPDKDLYITEYGIKPYTEFLISPSLYDNSMFSNTHFSNEVQRLFYGAFLKSSFKNKIKGVYFWFADYFTDNTCKYLNNFLGGEKYDID